MIAVYARVSTEEQATKGYSIGNQIDECIKKAGTSSVLKYIDDGFSGELLSRPELDRLREDVRKGTITKLVCYDPDRLSRKLLNQLLIDDEIRKYNVDLVFVNGEYANTPEGQLFFSMRGAISEFEKAKIKERTSSGRRRKAQQGLVVKDGGLYGYTYDKINNTYVINEEEAKFVRIIFDYFTDLNSGFEGINGIAMHLTEISAPTKKGGKVWHRQVVRQILLNPSYKGEYHQNKYDTEGDFVRKQAGEKVDHGKLRPKEEWITLEIPSIIEKEQFNYAQQLLQQARRRYTNYGVHNYLLSGMVRCGQCGGTMTGRKTKSHGKDFYIYECRKNYAGAKDNGCGRSMSENKLNNQVWGFVSDLLDNPEKINEHEEVPKKTYTRDELIHIDQEIEKTKTGRKRLLTLVSMSDEDMDIEEIKDKMRELQQKGKDLEEKKMRLQEELSESESNKLITNLLGGAVQYYLKEKGTNLTIEKKQNLLRMILKEIEVIDKDTVNIHTF